MSENNKYDDDFRVDMSFMDEEEQPKDNQEQKELDIPNVTNALEDIEDDDFLNQDEKERNYLADEDDEIEYYDDEEADEEDTQEKLTKDQIFNRIMIIMGGVIAGFTIFFGCVVYKEFFAKKSTDDTQVVAETETTTAEEVKEGAFVSPYLDTNVSDDVKDTINGAKLSPLETGLDSVDMKIESILDSTVDKDKNIYENTRNIYDYLVANYELNSEKTYVDEDSVYDTCSSVGYTSYFDMELIYRADLVTGKKTGCSQDFAAALTVLFRAYGLDAYYIDGQINTEDGDTESHGYTAVIIDDKYYIFDAAYEKDHVSEAQDNALAYTTFGAKRSAVSDIYDEEGFNTSIESFAKFETLGSFDFSAKFSVNGGSSVSASVEYSSSNNAAEPDNYIYADKGDQVVISGSVSGSTSNTWKLVVKEYDDDMNYIDEWTEYSSTDSSSTNYTSCTIDNAGYTKLTYMVTDENGRTCTITATVYVEGYVKETTTVAETTSETFTVAYVETTTEPETETTTEEETTTEIETETTAASTETTAASTETSKQQETTSQQTVQ